MELFAHHMSMVDQYSKVIEMLDADEETAKKLETSAWNREKCYFLMNLTMDDGSLLPLHIVDSDDFGSSVPAENEGVFCCAGDLPGMDEVGDQLHYCLTANGLFHWSEGNWIAITHVEEENHDLPETVDSNVNAASESFSHPEVSQAEATDSENAAAPIEPIAPVKQLAIPAAEPVEGLWLDDLSEETGVEPEVTIDEFANLSSAEIAGRLLSAASNGNIPSDENMAVLIHQLLNEGVRSHDVRNCHDQLVEAVVLQKCFHQMMPSRCAGTFTFNFMLLFRFFVRQAPTQGSRCQAYLPTERNSPPSQSCARTFTACCSPRMRMTIHSPHCTTTHSQNMNPSSLVSMS